MRKLLILDKDGTLITTKSGKKFVQPPQDQKIIPGMGKALIAAKNSGWNICVASNQLGIKLGYKTDSDSVAEFVYLHKLFPEIEVAVYCPDEGKTMTRINYKINNIATQNIFNWNVTVKKAGYQEELKEFRKPNPGMIQFLMTNFECQKNQDKIVYVGDRPEDEQAALNAGVVFIWADVFNQDPLRFL